jgi:pimeloyl-ACP methyl ester carboxylesterase
MTQAEVQTANSVPGAAFKEGYVDADGFHIRYREAGRGEPLVCLHGAGGLRLSRAHEILAERYRMIAFEAPGFGASPVNDRSGSAKELAASLAQAIANLGIDRYNLMGTSFGGRLALWWATQFPERLSALVLVAPAAIRPADGDGDAPPAGAAALYAHPERQPRLPPPDPAILAKQAALVQRLRGPARDPELEGQFATLTMPTLVLFGTSDRVIPSEMGRFYRELLPNCHFVLVYDAGHAIDADRPDAFAALVGDFLERREGFLIRRESGLVYP